MISLFLLLLQRIRTSSDACSSSIPTVYRNVRNLDQYLEFIFLSIDSVIMCVLDFVQVNLLKIHNEQNGDQHKRDEEQFVIGFKISSVNYNRCDFNETSKNKATTFDMTDTNRYLLKTVIDTEMIIVLII